MARTLYRNLKGWHLSVAVRPHDGDWIFETVMPSLPPVGTCLSFKGKWYRIDEIAILVFDEEAVDFDGGEQMKNRSERLGECWINYAHILVRDVENPLLTTNDALPPIEEN